LSRIGAVAGQACGVRQQLRDGLLRDLRMQIPDMLADRIVEAQFAPLPQLHDARGGECLGMRGDAKAVARCEFLAAVEIGETECALAYQIAALGDRDDHARLLRSRQLKFKPVGNVADGGP
jgi:hypothetical protein